MKQQSLLDEITCEASGCKNPRDGEARYCADHRCSGENKNGSRCKRYAEQEGMCKTHYDVWVAAWNAEAEKEESLKEQSMSLEEWEDTLEDDEEETVPELSDAGQPQSEPPATTPEEENAFGVVLTGHRPNKLGGFAEVEELIVEFLTRGTVSGNSQAKWVVDELVSALMRAKTKYGNVYLNDGEAMGADWLGIIAGQIANVPVHGYCPFLNHGSNWYEPSKVQYAQLVKLEAKRFLVTNKTWDDNGPKYMDDRNKAMVDNAKSMIAVWNGSRGGTANAVYYARKVGMNILFLNPHTRQTFWETQSGREANGGFVNVKASATNRVVWSKR